MSNHTHHRRLSSVSYTPIGLNVGALEKKAMEAEAAQHGLGVITAAIFLAGEMAGSGVLALPNAMVGTGTKVRVPFYFRCHYINIFSGWSGLILILLFTINACFSGTRLGQCWVILEERYTEFQEEIRDPYPSIGEKAVGTWGRVVSTLCIIFTLEGAGCVFIVLISQLVKSLISDVGVEMPLCLWMVIVTAFLIPLTWLGTPKDFWPIAVGALLSTVIACVLIVTQGVLDSQDTSGDMPEVEYPPPSLMGSAKAFASIMFAFAGASTFPTIQADMKNREKFHISACIACTILFLIYLPMGAVGYYAYGGGAEPNIVLNLHHGAIRITIEIMLLLHLVSAFPIILNPPFQYFEHILSLPSNFNWKRCLFRTLQVCVLLFIAESIPSFGAILDLVGASTVTLLTFVFPPLFYMRLCDQSKDNKDWEQRILPLWERIYCWLLIAVGLLGGGLATYTAVFNVVGAEMQVPCYLQSGNNTFQASH